MSLDPLVKGAAIGLSIAAPVGPIGVLCIRRTLSDGVGTGFAAGLGAATADAAYGCVAAFGLTSVSDLLSRYQGPMRLLGGAFLCYLGLRALLGRTPAAEANTGPASGAAVYFTTLLLTLSNPATVISFTMVFAALGVGGSPSYAAASRLVAGVFAGSALWWLILSSVSGLARKRLKPGWIRAVSGVSGCILIAFGILALSRL